MDIGPVRRRLTAEPISSPVPGQESPAPDPALVEEEQAEPVATSGT